MADEEKKLTDQFNILFDDITDDFGEAKEEAVSKAEEAAAEAEKEVSEAASRTGEEADELFDEVDNAFSGTKDSFDEVKEDVSEAAEEAEANAKAALQPEEKPAAKKNLVRQDPRSLMDEINMEDEERGESDEADDYEKDDVPKKPAKKPPYDDKETKKGMSSENLRFWIFTAVVALLVIAAVLFILWKRGIIFHGDDTTTAAPTVQTTEPPTPSETLPPETTTAVEETTTAPVETTTEVPEEVKEVLNHYQNLFVVRDKVGDNEVHTLNIREKADAESRIVAKIARYGGGEVLEAGDEWTKISSGGFTGFVKNEYIATGDEAKEMALQHADKYVRVTSENGLKIRQNASATEDPLMVAVNGAIMIYEGEEDGFYHINYADQFDGFVSMDFSVYDWYLMGAIPPEG
ncbi:MAG: SH3 domain-containing protein [Lachnospiraceae bacterium]|nr:SH3 domain-containing protein [Lachnospiraceae bacterium]